MPDDFQQDSEIRDVLQINAPNANAGHANCNETLCGAHLCLTMWSQWHAGHGGGANEQGDSSEGGGDQEFRAPFALRAEDIMTRGAENGGVGYADCI